VPRPLISSLAIYKDKSKNDHGDGFYTIASQLGMGDFKVLKDELFGFSEAERSRLYWQDDSNYKKFAVVTTFKPKMISDLFLNLVEKKENAWVENWKNDYLFLIENIRALRSAIIDNPTLSIDEDKLYFGLDVSIRNYESFMRKWLKEHSNGISSRGQSVLSEDNFVTIIADEEFKIFAKAIILKPDFENYTAFTGWWYRNEAINNRPLLINRAFAACNPENLSSTVDNGKFWKVIEIVTKSYGFQFQEEHHNWFTANSEFTKWLSQELGEVLAGMTADKWGQLVWRNIFVWLIFAEFNTEVIIPNSLFKRDKPTNGYSNIPQKRHTFEGVDIDFSARAKEQKDLGDAGEELVKRYEKERLKAKNMHAESLLVAIVKDGLGYDVLSFDDNGNEKYIEVKTTTGSAINPFYLTENEFAFMKSHVISYSIYRVYNYDEENNSGEFFELSHDVENQLLMQPVQYKVYIKKDFI